MSLDVYLKRKRWVSYDEGKTHTEEYEILYEANITHNLGRMAKEAGIYMACWRPEEICITKAKDLVPLLSAGLKDMKARPDHYKKFNSDNGWGVYDNFVPWVEEYLNACKEFPESLVEASR